MTTPLPHEFPEPRIRRVVTFPDMKAIMEAWSTWDHDRREAFGRLVAGVSDADLPGDVEDFLNDPAWTQTDPQLPDAGDDRDDDQDGDEPDPQLLAALATAATAEAYAREHPEDAADLLALERAGKARRTVLTMLSTLAEE